MNVSARQFADASFAGTVRQAVASSGLEPQAIMLELTESALLRRDERLHSELAELKGIGVKLAIDDFGTGYSSLSYLRDLPIDVVKMDKSFVEGIADSDQRLALAEGIVQIAKTLSLDVIAEGIETEVQRDLLSSMGCHYGQGFLLAMPMPLSRSRGTGPPRVHLSRARSRAAALTRGTTMDQRIITTSDRPDLAEQGSAALLADWPEFVLHDRCAPELMGRAWEYFPEFDVRLLEDGAVSAGGWAVPLRWNGVAGDLPDGYDGALTSALAGHRAAAAPDTMCVMAVAVRPDRQRAGLARPGHHRAARPGGAGRAAPGRRAGPADAEEPVPADLDGGLRQVGSR